MYLPALISLLMDLTQITPVPLCTDLLIDELDTDDTFQGSRRELGQLAIPILWNSRQSINPSFTLSLYTPSFTLSLYTQSFTSDPSHSPLHSLPHTSSFINTPFTLSLCTPSFTSDPSHCLVYTPSLPLHPSQTPPSHSPFNLHKHSLHTLPLHSIFHI